MRKSQGFHIINSAPAGEREARTLRHASCTDRNPPETLDILPPADRVGAGDREAKAEARAVSGRYADTELAHALILGRLKKVEIINGVINEIRLSPSPTPAFITFFPDLFFYWSSERNCITSASRVLSKPSLATPNSALQLPASAVSYIPPSL